MGRWGWKRGEAARPVGWARQGQDQIGLGLSEWMRVVWRSEGSARHDGMGGFYAARLVEVVRAGEGGVVKERPGPSQWIGKSGHGRESHRERREMEWKVTRFG